MKKALGIPEFMIYFIIIIIIAIISIVLVYAISNGSIPFIENMIGGKEAFKP